MFPASIASKPTFGAKLTARRDRAVGDRHVDYGVEDETPVGSSELAHGFDDGRADAAAPVRRMDCHGDLAAARVVAQRQLHHPHAENRATADRAAATSSKRFDRLSMRAKARMSGRVNPIRSGHSSLSLAASTAAPSASSSSSVRIDQSH